MEIDVKLPELGDGIKSGDILELLVKVGDQVQKDQGIAEVETDKATVTLPSTHAGVVTRVHVATGQTVPVGGSLISLEVAAAAATEKPAAPAPAPAPAPTPPPAPAPVAAPAAPAPAPVVPAPIAPVRPIAPTAAPVAPVAPVASMAAATDDDLLAAGPAVRRFAREVGVELSHVQGSGPGGRITREDVLAAVRAANQVARQGVAATAAPASPAPVARPADPAPATGAQSAAPSAAASASAVEPGAARDAWGPVKVEKMSKIRRTIAAKMHESWTTVPRVTNMDDADVTELERMRVASKEDYAARGIKLTSLPFVIKAVAMALKAHPVLNASIDMEAGTIVYKDYVNLGIAVDSERGLVVPSLRQADQLSISEIARQLATLADKVRDNSFAIDDLRGSTFTISNLGAVGGAYATPIVNTPEVAILLIGRARKLPVVVDDQIVPRLMMPLSLSYDHRVVDGGAAARFLNEVIGYLKAPGRLLLAP